MLRDIQKLINFVEVAVSDNFVLVEIVKTSGSTYKKNGLHKIIDLDNNVSCGIISGGCLEVEILNRARSLKNREETMVLDTSEELDRLLGSNLGCEGVMELSFRSFNKDESLKKCHELNKNLRPKITIIGAGPDATPLKELLDWSNWDYQFFTVRDDTFVEKSRGGWKISEFDLSSISKRLDRENSFLILMSHNFSTDLEILKTVIEKKLNPIYMGLLGPRKRKEQLILDLKRIHSLDCSEDILKIISAPVGIDGLGKGESAIGLSIIAEIQNIIYQQEQKLRGLI